MPSEMPLTDNPIEIHDFIRLCLISGRQPAAIEQSMQMAGDLDWQAVVAYAIGNSIAPLLYRSLKGSPLLPDQAREALYLAYLETARRNLLMEKALQEMLAAFQPFDIETIVLKGLALAIQVYENIAARPCRDIDLLLPVEHISQAVAAGQALGYALVKVPERQEAHIEFNNEILLYRADQNIFLEIHWGLFDSPFYQRNIDMGWFRRQTTDIQIAGIAVKTFSPESNLIYLCGHMALHHEGKELLWLNDIAELIDRCQAQINWQLIMEKAQEYRLILPVRQTLAQLVEEWGSPVPKNVLDNMYKLTVTSEETQIFTSLSGERKTAGWRFWNDLTSLRDWQERMSYSANMIFPSAAYMRYRYQISHPLLLPLYYPYRWWLGIASLFKTKE